MSIVGIASTFAASSEQPRWAAPQRTVPQHGAALLLERRILGAAPVQALPPLVALCGRRIGVQAVFAGRRQRGVDDCVCQGELGCGVGGDSPPRGTRTATTCASARPPTYPRQSTRARHSVLQSPRPAGPKNSPQCDASPDPLGLRRGQEREAGWGCRAGRGGASSLALCCTTLPPRSSAPSQRVPVASIPRCKCMKEGLSGVLATLCRQASDTASGGSRRSVSGATALDTTARRARMVRPPRSRTPWSGGTEQGQGQGGWSCWAGKHPWAAAALARAVAHRSGAASQGHAPAARPPSTRISSTCDRSSRRPPWFSRPRTSAPTIAWLPPTGNSRQALGRYHCGGAPERAAAWATASQPAPDAAPRIPLRHSPAQT